MKKLILVIGAGFSGATAARMLADRGHFVHLIDRDSHIGGAAYDFKTPDGLLVGSHGAHIFHTNMDHVWNFVTQFSHFEPVKHTVYSYNDQLGYIHFPPSEKLVNLLGEEKIRDLFYRSYSEKMWGISFDELPNSIKNRKPIGAKDLFYFHDKYEGVPKDGYTRLLENMLDHQNIIVDLNTEAELSMIDDFDFCFSSCSIDTMFGYKHGSFRYRGIQYLNYNQPIHVNLNVPVINYSNDSGGTIRSVNWRHFYYNDPDKFSDHIINERPFEAGVNSYERHYPLPWLRKKYLQSYKNDLEYYQDKLKFIGRLGQYAYLDMDEAISSSMKSVKDYLYYENSKAT